MAGMMAANAQYAKERLKRSPLVRTLAAPYMRRKLARLDEEYAQSEDSARLRAMKGNHAGERCFIVGNGPSLTLEDLDLIAGECSFAANGIYNVFPQTKWRPTFYVCVDRNALSLGAGEIKSLQLDYVFLELFGKRYIGRPGDNVIYINLHLSHYSTKKFTTDNVEFSHELARYVCSGYTVTYAMMQLALYMGFSEVYLLGIDHTYGVRMESDGSKSTVHEGNDHFWGKDSHKGYYYYEGVEHAYRLAQEAADAQDSRILNATRGGRLEIFKRVSFDRLMGNKCL